MSETDMTPLVDAAERAYVGCLLLADDATARRLVDLVPSEAITSPSYRWARDLVAAAVAGSVPLDAVALVDLARQRRMDPPAEVGSIPLSWLSSIRSEAPPPVMGDHFAGMLLDYAAHRLVAEVGARIAGAAWAGSVTDVIGVVRQQVARLDGVGGAR